MVKNYDEWLQSIEFQSQEDNEDEALVILNSYYGVVDQYLKSPTSAATKGLLDSATECVKKYLREL
jgi:hypothetical protein